MVLDGSDRVDNILRTAMPWDVMSGVARRAWARNENSIETVIEFNKENSKTDHITLPYIPREDFIDNLLKEKLNNIKLFE